MTTITIKEDLNKLQKTEFEDSTELFLYLKERLSPVSVVLADSDDFSPAIQSSIAKAQEEGEQDVLDFQG